MLETMGQQTAEMKRQANELIEQSYQRGYREGYSKAENDYHAKTEEDRQSSYELGLNMAWEAAKKVFNDEVPLSIFGLFDIHECIVYSPLNSIQTMTASEAIEKIREYEEKKKREEEPKLKPCPFCGSTDIRIYRPAVEYYVRCHNCFVTKGEFDTEEEATDEWNKRAGGSE